MPLDEGEPVASLASPAEAGGRLSGEADNNNPREKAIQSP